MTVQTLTLQDLLAMSRAELDELYKSSSPGSIPEGDGKGTAIVGAGTVWARLLAGIIRLLAWQGKVFDRDDLLNKVTLFRIRAIKAVIYRQESWLDGKETIVLDYSKTSFLAQKIRDEIREVAPGIYMGKVYWGKKRTPIDFILEFLSPDSQSSRGTRLKARSVRVD